LGTKITRKDVRQALDDQRFATAQGLTTMPAGSLSSCRRLAAVGLCTKSVRSGLPGKKIIMRKKSTKIALFDLDDSLVDHSGQVLKDLQKMAAPCEPPPVLHSKLPHYEARYHAITSQVGWWRNLASSSWVGYS